MGRIINKFKVTCPDCSAVVITTNPSMIVWERCPSCGRHIWDMYDALLAEVYVDDRNSADRKSYNAEDRGN